MRMGPGVRTGLGHGGITCVLQTQFSTFFKEFLLKLKEADALPATAVWFLR